MAENILREIDRYSPEGMGFLAPGTILHLTTAHPYEEGFINITLVKALPEQLWQSEWFRQENERLTPVDIRSNDYHNLLATGLEPEITEYRLTRDLPDMAGEETIQPEKLDMYSLHTEIEQGFVVMGPPTSDAECTLYWRIPSSEPLLLGILTKIVAETPGSAKEIAEQKEVARLLAGIVFDLDEDL